MSIFRRLSIVSAIVYTATLIVGCGGKPAMPEVNDENCKDVNVNKIQDKETRQEFAGKCLRRGGFVPSQQRSW